MALKEEKRSFDDDSLHEWWQLVNGPLHLRRDRFWAHDLNELLHILSACHSSVTGKFMQNYYE